ncbi:MAG: glycosyltransferase family 39 protein [Candidatus Dormibacteraeota bacterium]|nr:glycosyltransferase family 39 protein [Candidatus Dormibacteraeota bacterium]
MAILEERRGRHGVEPQVGGDHRVPVAGPERGGAPPAHTVRLVLGVLALVLIAFGIRLFVGMHQRLDADEAVEGISALRILHGDLALMENNARYQGALDSYLIAPFLMALGPSLLAVRTATAFFGALYVGLMFALGRRVLNSDGAGFLVGGIATLFPLYAITFGTRARTYGLLLVLETLVLLLWIRLAWSNSRPGGRAWAVTGLLAGLGLWTNLLLALPTAVGLTAALARGHVSGWQRAWRSLALAAVGAAVGFLPWIVYNTAVSQLGSLRHLDATATAHSTSPISAFGYLLSTGLPIFVGVQQDDCGSSSAPALAVDLALLALALAVVYLRRRSLASLVRGRFSELEPVDTVLAMGPLTLLAVSTGFFPAVRCEPRYVMPLAVPLAFAVGLVLMARVPWRAIGVAMIAGWLAVEVVVAHDVGGPPADPSTAAQAATRVDLAAATVQVEAAHPQAVWAEIWLARPVQFYSGDRLVVGEYGGYVGFPATQRRAMQAEHPSWLFMDSDRQVAAFTAECARRRITYSVSRPAPGLVLFSRLSQPLTPSDLHLGGQSLDQV